MTALARPEQSEHLVELLAASRQVPEWSEALHRRLESGDRLVVAHGPGRVAEADRFSRAFPVPSTALDIGNGVTGSLGRGDLLVVIVSADTRRLLHPAGGLAVLHRLLRAGVIIWGITGPRPNPVAPYCHDIVAVPEQSPSRLLRSHRLVVDLLTRPPSSPRALTAVPTAERGPPSDT